MFDQVRWRYRAWRYRCKLEKQEIRWLLQNVEHGSTVVDIGAHKAAFTYWLHRSVGPAGKVYAFEPQPLLAKALNSLLRAPRYRNVQVEQKGLSSRPGTLELRIPGLESSPGATFEQGAGGTNSERRVPVEVTTLDRYFSQMHVDFIKCDAEGHELEVFRGAESLLRRDQPDLLFECESRHLRRHAPQAVFEFLQNLGYQGFAFGPGGLFDITDFDPAMHQANSRERSYVNNFLFTCKQA